MAEFGGKGNIKNILLALPQQLHIRNYIQQANVNVWYFPSIAEYTTLLENAGFHVHMAQLYQRETELGDAESGIRVWLHVFSGAFFVGIPDSEKEEIIKAAERSLKETNYHHGKWFADYKRLRVIATKPSL